MIAGASHKNACGRAETRAATAAAEATPLATLVVRRLHHRSFRHTDSVKPTKAEHGLKMRRELVSFPAENYFVE